MPSKKHFQKNKTASTLSSTEEKLQASELRFRTMIEHANDMIWTLDAKGNFTFFNHQAEIISGYKLDNWLGKSFAPLIYPDDLPAIAEVFKKVMVGISQQYTVRFYNNKKQIVFLSVNTAPIYEKGKIAGTFSFGRDITENKLAEQKLIAEKNKAEAILTSISDAVFACDKNGKIILFNKTAEHLTGLRAKEAIGRHYREVISFVRENDEKPIKDFIAEAIKSDKITAMANHTILVRNDGRKIPVADAAAPIKQANGGIIGCVVVFRDVTKEREIDKAKTEFVSIASHQLRTPLSTVSWYSEMLLAGDAGDVNKKQKKYLEEIYKGNKQMVALVNALLNVSRIELGTFSVNPKLTDISTFAQNVVGEFKLKILQKKQLFNGLAANNLPKMRVDQNLLRTVLQNLLVNAINYTPQKGKIELDISVIKAGGKIGGKKISNASAVFIISDSGYGIPKTQQDMVFTKFFRADNIRKKNIEGTGLGLYIIKSIVDQVGGSIWFLSPPPGKNKGTAFYITLPLNGMKRKKGTKALA
ncbi:MAG: PAS domain S-box protein [bacterium]